MSSENSTSPRHSLLRLPEVMNRTGLSRSSVYLRMKRGDFPKPIQLGPRAIAWVEKDIQEFIAGCIDGAYGQPRPLSQAGAASAVPMPGNLGGAGDHPEPAGDGLCQAGQHRPWAAAGE